jgi:hypothetical protein
MKQRRRAFITSGYGLPSVVEQSIMPEIKQDNTRLQFLNNKLEKLHFQEFKPKKVKYITFN